MFVQLQKTRNELLSCSFEPARHGNNKQAMKKQPGFVFALFISLFCITGKAQPVMETGGQKMPAVWIDQDTHHKIVRLTDKEGSNAGFYFHNNPFIGNRMVFYSNDRNGRQIWTLDMQTKKNGTGYSPDLSDERRDCRTQKQACILPDP